MRLKSLHEQQESKIVVVFGGRFQPFHKGHYRAYKWLCEKFGKDNVWIATSNKTNFSKSNGKVSPFNYKEKRSIISELYGVEPRRIIRSENPAFSPKEILSLYKGVDTIYITAVGKKDVSRYTTGDYFEKLPNNLKDLKNSSEAGYYIGIPDKYEGISGTEVREKLIKANEKDLPDLSKDLFGSYDKNMMSLIMKRLKDVR